MATAEGYITDVAYVPNFCPDLAPVLMRYVASLNRVVPPKVADGFRYLELGCGFGRSLTTLAAANPKGQFVGVDVNPSHTASIEKDIAAGKLANARVITAEFGKLPEDLGTFEFIALQGVLSWVAPQVRDEILAIAAEHLAPGGLLLVSYNAMPGWAHLQPIRGIVRQYAALRQGDSVQRLRDALAYLVFTRDRHAKYFQDNPSAGAYVDGLLRTDPRYLVHEFLNEHWKAFYFAEVAEMFGGAGLAFVGSLPVFTNFWNLCVRAEFQELFRGTSDRLVTELHKDFCANTVFRCDVYAKTPRTMPEVADRLREADDLYFRVARPDITLPCQVNLGVVEMTVQGRLYQLLLKMLAEKSLRLSEILAAPEVQGTPPKDVAGALDSGVAVEIFEVTTGSLAGDPAYLSGPLKLTSAFNMVILESDSLSGRPVALASEKTGTGYTLSDFEAAILHELVERGRDGLAARVGTRLAGRGLALQQNGKAVNDAAQRAKLVQQACAVFLATSLPHLARLGIVARA